MEIEKLEQQLQIWNRFMYMALGATITLIASSPNNFSYAGIIWLLLLIATIPPGVFLLYGKRWKVLPLIKERTNTIVGYLFAGLLLLSVPSILGANPRYLILVAGYLVLSLSVLYLRIYKKRSDSDEMFP